MDLSLLPKGRYVAKEAVITLKYNHRSISKPFALEVKVDDQSSRSNESIMKFIDLNTLVPDPRSKDEFIKKIGKGIAATVLFDTMTSYVSDGKKVKPYTKVSIPRYIIVSKDLVFVNVR